MVWGFGATALAFCGILSSGPAVGLQIPISSGPLFNKVVSGHSAASAGNSSVQDPFQVMLAVVSNAQDEIARIVTASQTGQTIAPADGGAGSGTTGAQGASAGQAAGSTGTASGTGGQTAGGAGDSSNDILKSMGVGGNEAIGGAAPGGGTGAGQTGTGTTAGSPATTGTTETPTGGSAEGPPALDPGQRITRGLVSSDSEDFFAFLNDIAAIGKVVILPDETLKAQTIQPSLNLSGMTVVDAITRVAKLQGAYVKEVSPGVFYVSKATTVASMFHDFASSTIYKPRNQPAATIQLLLSTAYKDYVQVDPKMNEISITAAPELLDRILKDIKTIDAAPKQIVVEAMVVEITDEKDDDFGFSWSWKNFGINSSLSATYTTATTTDMATLQALITNHKATLKANPRLSAFEGQESSFIVGQDIYIIINGGNTALSFGQITEIKTGITLKFTGYIGDDGQITLKLNPEVSDAVILGVGGSPTTNVRSADTTVRIKSGQTIAIGGLVEDQIDRQKTGIPILSQFPIIGDLFTQHTYIHKKTDVIVLIRPHVSDDGVGFSELPDDSQQRKVTPSVGKGGVH